MDSAESTTKITLKLLIDKRQKRVLFAEAGKDFVDFFFGLLELPIGAILNLLYEGGMVKSWPIANVFQAVQTIDPTYFQPNQTKASLLNPKSSPSSTKQTPLLQQFGCIGHQQQVNTPDDDYYSMPRYGTSKKELVDGYVKGMVTYMVMDDLTLKPMSTISCITILHTFQVKDVGCLVEKTVQIDKDMARRLVKASFDESSKVLTDVLTKPEDFDFEPEESSGQGLAEELHKHEDISIHKDS